MAVAAAWSSGTALAQGALTNGGRQTGNITAAGQADSWTAMANVGDEMTFQVAKTAGGAGFTPRIEVFSPSGASLGASSGSLAARLDIQADSVGTYTVTVSDETGTGTGSYGLQMAQAPESFVVPQGDEGGPMLNGTNNDGTIDLGDLDLWTFSAAAGDHVTLQIAKLSGGAGFTPMLEVIGPDGRRLNATSAAVAARQDLQADMAGTYTVLVSDANQSGTGTYRLRLAQVPEAYVVVPGDQGGALTNGANTLGTVDVGDLDQWSFAANAGDHVTLQLAKLTGGAAFTPLLELFGPDGTRLAHDADLLTARVDVQARTTGTYRVLVSASSPDGSGNYQLQLAQVPATLTIPPGDEGGPLADGVDQDGTITMGDLDAWTFAASPGDRITLVGTELTGGAGFEPKLELFDPTGQEKASAQNAPAATVDVAAEQAGTYTLLVSDANKSGAGTYQIHLTRGTIAPPGTNVLVNGTTYLGDISPAGHQDLWTFTASAGENIVIRGGKTTASTLTPMLQLYGPDGALLSSAYSGVAAEVVARATNSGTFSVLVRDNSNGQLGTGNYRLSMAKTGSPLVISPTDEGGPLVNGPLRTGTIDTGDIDAWSVTANAGEMIVVRMGKSGTGTLTPQLRLYGPNGAMLNSSYGGVAAEVAARATNSGTFLIVASDNSNGWAGSGNYQIVLDKTGEPLVRPGAQLVNGTTDLGTIEVGQIDGWSFTANAGQTMVVRMGEVTTTGLTPELRLYGPGGELLSFSYGGVAAEVTARATNSGTYLVLASDNSNGWAGSGNYQISLAETGSPLTISATDEGGSLVNGTTYLGSIPVGDIDAWTVIANAGQSIVARMGETVSSTLTPYLRIYGPGGELLDVAYGGAAADVAVRATNSGTFLILAGDNSNGWAGSGDYRFSMAKTGSPLTISPNDDGGTVVNGTTYLGIIDVGDIDPWTFTAHAGDSLVLSMGETTTTTLTPSFRVYGPDGALLGSSYGSVAAQVFLRATNSGSFLVVAGDDSNGWAGYGNYRLSLAKTGSAPMISPNDEGGPMMNGFANLGTIDVGDIDPWTFTATAGENIIVRMGEVTSSSLTPSLHIYGPDGALLGFSYGAAAAEVDLRATNSGTFLVVASDDSNGWAGSGNYRLTLGMTGSPLLIAPGSEGGAMTNGFGYTGSIDTGGLGIWNFTACDGIAIDLQVQALTGGTAFTPQLRLYAPDGTLLRSTYNASFIDVVLTAPELGTYTVVVSDDSNGLGGSGTYQLVGTGISSGLMLCDPLVQGANLVLRAAGGQPAGAYAILTTTNVALPINEWTPVDSNQFDVFGTLRLTNGFRLNVPQEYFLLRER